MEEQSSRFELKKMAISKYVCLTENMTNGENSSVLILSCKGLMHCCQLIQWPYFVALLL